MFENIYQNKKVLVTGNTGFKGSWLTSWLLKLGADVVGYSKDIPTSPAMFDALGIADRISQYEGDVRDLARIKDIIQRERPDYLFHLAAQAIVSISYTDPVETITSNTIGTMNVLEALRTIEHPCVAIMITSDKAYDNVEWVWGYRETDPMGGKDVYSGSKGAAELVIRSYIQSFFMHERHPVRIAIGRAGNVIGGGDWAKDRIVVDCVSSWSEGRSVEIRCPRATRPWQHVLEPLSGYLALGATLTTNLGLHGEAFNFGPRAEQSRTVVELLTELAESWGFKSLQDAFYITENIPFHEAHLLKLNCDKAMFHLNWEATLDYSETIRLTGDWYRGYYQEKADMYPLTMSQIAEFEFCASERGRIWAGKN